MDVPSTALAFCEKGRQSETWREEDCEKATYQVVPQGISRCRKAWDCLEVLVYQIEQICLLRCLTFTIRDHDVVPNE
jgi:hypothetical protein